MMTLSKLVDAAMEALVVPSFTRLGPSVRTRTHDWEHLERIDGVTVAITGATSGIGRAAATTCARLGAAVLVGGRSPDRTADAARAIAADADVDADRVDTLVGDMGDLAQVRDLAGALFDWEVDVVVHNAGALTHDRRITSDGFELTVASQVLGPFLLNHLLADHLGSVGGRVITVSSGGMYTERLRSADIEFDAHSYHGTKQYARAKRAQVTLNEMFAERFGDVTFAAMHPGWVDTPGVAESLPTFGRVMGPLLRTPDEGADTLVWLTTQPEIESGRFWLDRSVRPIHRLGTTASSDTPERRAELWAWCADATGVGR